jgi:hypothetical protein
MLLKAKQIIASNVDYGFKAAYRQLSGEQYTILWPENLTEFKII